ncbi:MAG TPA: methionyl-tRNA formyltransferase [Ktedonobacter sp.]|nr:methionyl-tRNA formyltransferase [Ktedonobacter sp.]HAT46684.1 methionyl-tRNA formyltransferase [Ktedonobacter sp.]HBE29655.1 methionyl-tRNA formyltransferase [Ktedonobacter sp.]HCF85497.1 methionyl-tRNA formyltransferase [Ktedonobacter sp.]HCJ34719.1 methionyl-tRNA formyltransferase [Ktedonobacter sp.]
MLRILYMGTPQFAIPALEALLKGAPPGVVLPEGYEIVTVITRPDKPVGRGQGIIFSPVKQVALAHNIPVWQPGSFKRPENSAGLAAYHADLFIVAAFGQILPQAVLDLPRYGTLNIHASLLPKYRGVSPISEAILQGDAETGVTIMLIDAGVDTGPLLLKRSIPIAEDETTGSLTLKLADLGAQALLEVLPQWISGKITPIPQDNSAASHTRMLRKEDGKIAWEQPASVLARKVRAYTPWPGTYTYWRGKLLKIISARAFPQTTSPEPVTPGTVSALQDAGHKSLAIATGNGSLVVEQLQLEGKKAMSAQEFLRGYPQIIGETLRPH